METTTIIYTILSFLSFLLNLAPTAWHLQQGNASGFCLGFWTVLLNFIAFVNCVVWRNDAVNRAPIWCDISAKVEQFAPVGLGASILCISLYLAQILSPTAFLISHRSQQRRHLKEYAFCLGFPVLLMALHIVHQSRRFGLVKGLGCAFTFSPTWATLVLWLVWSTLLQFLGAICAVYIIFRALKHRRDFKRIVEGSSQAITLSRFIRLCALSASYVFIFTPMSVKGTLDFLNSVPLTPYISWGYWHESLSDVLVLPDQGLSWPAWSGIVAGVSALVLFGFGAESWTIYRAILVRLGLLKEISPKITRQPVTQSISAQLNRLETLGEKQPGDTSSVASGRGYFATEARIHQEV
ncbi:STE3-domain-containing protein [Atractiella rhizophila]|nr:STE3-domain-containing protein [Atractiella rhizophila]